MRGRADCIVQESGIEIAEFDPSKFDPRFRVSAFSANQPRLLLPRFRKPGDAT
jgi:hypothetical protein